MMKLADACIEFLQETLEHYGEALNVYDRMMYEMNETFWQLYGVDMESVLAAQDPGSRDILPLFHKLNAYFYEEQELRYGKFHMHLSEVSLSGFIIIKPLKPSKNINASANFNSGNDAG
jgi:hypothetical protein